MNKKESLYYPAFLNVRGRKCVVVGGGQVARRKVEALLDCGACVEVISPDFCPELNHLVEIKEIYLHQRHYHKGDLLGAFLVIAATGDRYTNLQVAEEAEESNILVNVVDYPDYSDFIIPSSLKRGDITIAVSTAGKSPALARKIRLRLDKDLAEEYTSLVQVVSEVRSELKSSGIKVDTEKWQKAIDLDLMIDLLKKNNRAEVKNLLFNNLKK